MTNGEFEDIVAPRSGIVSLKYVCIILRINEGAHMKVSMAEVNKKANLIINHVAESGEVAIIMKHGKPIAEIRPIPSQDARNDALAYLTGIEPVKVKQSVEKVVNQGRKRGI